MEKMSPSEKWAIIRHHVQVIGNCSQSMVMPDRQRLLESAARIAQLIKSMPKSEFS